MNIILVTDVIYLGCFISKLFDSNENVKVYPCNLLDYVINTISKNDCLVLSVPCPTEKDWRSFVCITKAKCLACYLMVGKSLTVQEYHRAIGIGFKEVFLDPLVTYKMNLNKNKKLNLLVANQSKQSDNDVVLLSNNTYFHTKELWVGTENNKRNLSNREVGLLNLFLQNEGKVVYKSQIAKELWNELIDVGGIGRLVNRLRSKLGHPDLITGRKQGGYIFKRIL